MPGDGFVPLCMTAEELEAWWEANRVSMGRHLVSRPCSDCPSAFAEEMRSEGRCNGVPLGDLEDDEDDLLPLRERVAIPA